LGLKYKFGGLNRFGSAQFIAKESKLFIFEWSAGSFYCSLGIPEDLSEPSIYSAILFTFKFLK
jgi:hypothetical protein